MSEEDKKASEWVAKAEKSEASWAWFNPSKWDDALESYERAANQYKLIKNWTQAAAIYEKMAALAETKTKSMSEAASNYTNCAQAYQNANDVPSALRVYRIAVKLHADNDRFSTAARLWKEIAKLEEHEIHNKQAIEAWDNAARCHDAENGRASAQQALINVARLAAIELDYKRAIEIYEKVAQQGIETDIGRWQASDYFYKAAICQFVMDAKVGNCSAALSSVARYIELHPMFETTRECKFLNQLLAAFKDDSVEAFTAAVAKYDSISKLDTWTAKMLLSIKRVLLDGVKDGGPDDDEILSGAAAPPPSAAAAYASAAASSSSSSSAGYVGSSSAHVSSDADALA